MSKVRVLVNPSRHEMGSGATSTISFENPDFRKGLNVMFGITEKERIEQIEIHDEWITARIGTVKLEPNE